MEDRKSLITHIGYLDVESRSLFNIKDKLNYDAIIYEASEIIRIANILKNGE